MAEHLFQNPFGSFTLDLFPPDRGSTHRAWDAADLFILEEISQQQIKGPVLLVNDTNGALHTALSKQVECHLLEDSALSRASVKQNLEQNGFNPCINEMEATHYPLVIVKIPKTLSLLEYQLRELRNRVDNSSRILAGAMTRHIHRSTIELFEKILGPSTTSLAKKKARLIHSSLDPDLTLTPYNPIKEYSIPGIPEPLLNGPNLFSRDRLDRGTSILLNYMDITEGPRNIADFGCGNGVIGIQTLLKNPEAKLTAVDDSLLAVESTQKNAERNGLSSRVKVIHGYELPKGPYDLVLSNPPFHQGQKVDLKPTLLFFEEAADALKADGSLILVANRHLGYHSHLQKIFRNCKILADEEGFLVLSCIRK